MPAATIALDRASADIPLTRAARDDLERAATDAAKRGADESNPVDVLRAVLANRGSLAVSTLRTLGADTAAVAEALPEDGQAPPLPLRQLLVNANREAQVLGHYQVDSIHLLLALLYSDSPATSAALQKAGLTMYDLRRHLQTGLKAEAPVTGAKPAVARAPDRALRRRPLPRLRGVLGVSPIFLGLVALAAVSGSVLWFDLVPQAPGVVVIVFVLSGWIVTVCIHEFGHAFIAYLGGDRGVAASGYLTLDPRRYTNVLMSIVLPVAFLLLGGIPLPGAAVYIDHSALRSRWWDSAVSAAGPIATAICCVVVSSPFLLVAYGRGITGQNILFFEALAFLAFMEAVSVILNLLPVPGIDGFGIIRPWLPYSLQAASLRFGFMPLLIVYGVLWYVGPAAQVFFGTALHITGWFSIDANLIYLGQLHMHLH